MRNLYETITKHAWFSNRYAEYYRWYPKSLTVANSPPSLEGGVIRGIYVHVPFCDELCKFCPFNKRKNHSDALYAYVEALTEEIQIYSDQGVRGDLEFIYFGGGTPSVLSDQQFAKILKAISNKFNVRNDCEVSIEAHPTHIYRANVVSWKAVGINRVSSGIQSFSPINLKSLGATHTVEDSIRAVEILSDIVDNAAIDLLYRCVGQSVADWKLDLKFLDEHAHIEHISCYTLFLPNADSQPDIYTDVQMAVVADEFFSSRGFTHYASCATGGFDFAKPDKKCRYEALHWATPQASYVALGPGALGYVNNTLLANFHNLPSYINSIHRHTLPILSSTVVDQIEQKHRFFTLGVKTLQINLDDYTDLFGSDPNNDFSIEFSQLKDLNLITIDNNKFALTDIGRFYVDQISELFWSKEQMGVPHPETSTLMRLEKEINSRILDVF